MSGDAAVIRVGDTLTVPAGAQLTNNLTLTNNGTLIIENMNSISGSGTISGGRNVILDPGAARLTISLPQSTVYDGKTDYAEQISLVLKDKLVIQGAEFEFDASGWTMQLTRDGKAVTSAVDEGLYTVVFSRGGVSVGPACFSVTRVNLPDAMSYPVVVEPSEHGSVTVSGGWAVVGSEVTLTVTPDEGWRPASAPWAPTARSSRSGASAAANTPSPCLAARSRSAPCSSGARASASRTWPRARGITTPWPT